MSNKILTGIVALIVGVIIGAGLSSSGTLGGVTVEDEVFKGAVTVEGAMTNNTITTTDDLTVGEDLILTDNDFCIQFYATSTATTIKMVASTTVASGSNIGLMTMQYGTCVE